MSKKIFDAFDLKKFDVTRRYDDDVFDPYEGIHMRDHFLLYSIFFILIVFIVWANFASLEEVTRGEGTVIPSSEVKVIQNLEGGIIDKILVREGDTVEKGQTLVRLRNIQASSDLSSNLKRYLGTKAIVQRLEAEAAGLDTIVFTDDVVKGVPQSVANERETFSAKIAQSRHQLGILEQQLDQKKQEVAELTRRISDTQKVLNLSQREMDMLRPAVERGSAPEMELLQLERSIAERQSELNGLRLALPRSKSAVNEVEQRIAEHNSTRRAEAQSELAERIVEMNALKETLSALEDRRDRTTIISPVNGIVTDVKFSTEGGVVQPGEEIMEVVPMDDSLMVEARIRPSDIAFLFQGQKAVVKITAYDYTIYGGLEGEVLNISADTITANQQGGGNQQEDYYRVRVRTDETALHHNGDELLIKPGMKAQVDILTGEKTVMDYILKPFKKAARSALRER
jgi:adhesin transport system membrane fusion protein